MYKACRALLIGSIGLLVYSLVVLFGQVSLLILGVCVAILCLKRGYGQLTAYGTAKWSGLTDLGHMLDAPRGIILGHLPVKWTADMLFRPSIPSRVACRMMFGHKPVVRLPNAVHTAIFAPTGVGKGASFCIPHLLTCPESTIVVDVKGENAKLTAAFRHKAFGHRIVSLDPFRVVTKNPDSFNPLDFIKADSPLALDECRDLANSLFIRTGQEKEPHWGDAAEMNIAGITSLVVQYAPESDRSLQTVRDILADPQQLEAAIFSMSNSKACEGIMARSGHQLSHFKDRELSSTLTTTGRFLRFLDTLAILESTKNSSFDPADLLKGKMTIWRQDRKEDVVFRGGIICISNRELHDDELLGAFKSRVHTLNYDPTDAQLGALMLDLADRGWPVGSSHPEINPETARMIAQYLIGEMLRVSCPFDLRLLVNKAFPDYQQWKDGEAESDWRDLITASIEEHLVAVRHAKESPLSREDRKEEEYAIVEEIVRDHQVRDDRVRAWIVRTGKSERAFYRRLAEMR